MFKYPDYSTIFINSYFKDRLIRVFLILSALANLLVWVFFAWHLRDFPDSLPLHYNIYFGPDLFGPWYQILFIPALGLLFFAVNGVMGFYFYNRERLLSYFLTGVAFFISVLLLLASVFIIFLNY